jgi:TusA-related sulfurtransferase
MEVETVDIRGLKSPQHILEIALRAVRMKPGAVLEVRGDCPTLEDDVRAWCVETRRTFLSADDDGDGAKIIRIQF